MIGLHEDSGHRDSEEKVYYLPKLDLNIKILKVDGDVRVDLDTPSLAANNDMEHAAMHGVLLLLSTMLSEDFETHLLADIDSLESVVKTSLEKIPPLIEQVQKKGFWLGDE